MFTENTHNIYYIICIYKHILQYFYLFMIFHLFTSYLSVYLLYKYKILYLYKIYIYIYLCLCRLRSHRLFPSTLTSFYYSIVVFFQLILGSHDGKMLKIKVVMLLEGQSLHKSLIPKFLQYFCPFICNFPSDLGEEVVSKGIHWDWPLV